MAHDVFISHSSKDKAIADAACALLEGRKVRCWIAPRDVPPGVPYGEALLEAIHGSRVMVLVFSTNSNGSAQVMREVERAVSKGIPILPFRIENVLPTKAMEYFISSHHWLDAMSPPLEAHLARLADSVAALLSGAPAAPAAPAAIPSGPTFAELESRPQALVGTKVGPWHVEQLLGQGGSGFAYRATNTALGREACLKALRKAPRAEEAVGAALARGVRGLASLSHPNVVKVHDFGKLELADGASWYLTMDLVRGLPLDEWSRALPAPAFPARFAAAVALTRGLEAAHGCRFADESGFEVTGILHGDLKPANVLVRDGGDPVLLDFMIVDVQRLVAPGAEGISNVTKTGSFGTEGYMAPEQSERGVVTTRSDLYGLGMTLGNLFAPDHPDPAHGVASAEDVPSELKTLIFSMLEKNPERRPASAADVASRLVALQQPGASSKEKPGLFTRLAKAIRGS